MNNYVTTHTDNEASNAQPSEILYIRFTFGGRVIYKAGKTGLQSWKTGLQSR